MLAKRFKYDEKSIARLNELQLRAKKQIERKIEEGIYQFEEISCCICDGNNFKTLSEKDRYGLWVPVIICRDCGLIQANPRMTQDAYAEFYEEEYRKLYVGTRVPTDDFFIEEYQKGGNIYRYLKENLGIDLINLKVLEIGTGAGGILSYFKEKGNDVCGYDLGSEYIEFGRNKYDLDIHVGTIDDVDINWVPDIVIYSHVLEHVLNPIEELTKLKSIIDDNSYVYIELPGVKNLMYTYERDFLKQLQNAHVYYFTLTTLKNVFEKVGYDFVCGNESIYGIFKRSSNKNGNYENDYTNVISFLKKMEFYRVMPTPYNIKRLAMPALISFLKRAGLYNVAKGVFYKFKS